MKPKIKTPPTSFDIIAEALAALCLIFMVIQLIIEFPELNDKVVTHFNATGAPDAWGSKSSMLILTIITIGLYAGLTIVNKYPHVFNYPLEITEENAFKQYRLAKSLITTLKAFCTGLFLYIQYNTIEVAKGNSAGLGSLFFMFVIAGTILPIVVYFIMASKQK